MRIRTLLASLALVSMMACGPSEDDNAKGSATTQVSFGAAFTDLASASVYGTDGTPVATADQANGLTVSLPSGRYLVDFVDVEGNHSFTRDGRLAFAPTMEGAAPAQGAVSSPSTESPLWLVEVGALALTIQPMDETNSRLRVIWEASFAMKGNFTLGCRDTESCWLGSLYSGTSYYSLATSGTTNASPPPAIYYSYIDYDPISWALLLQQTGQYPAGFISCKDPGSTVSPCYVPNYGSANAVTFTCQAASCTASTHPRGGECKAFMNLLLYRSTVYRTAANGWLALPTDTMLSTPNSTKWPTASSSNLMAGDALRSIGGHATTVVYIPSSGNYRVVDSNWVGGIGAGGGGYEYIGSHVMTTSNLSGYKNLKCVYASGDSRCSP
jgi:hypothetical protein